MASFLPHIDTNTSFNKKPLITRAKDKAEEEILFITTCPSISVGKCLTGYGRQKNFYVPPFQTSRSLQPSYLPLLILRHFPSQFPQFFHFISPSPSTYSSAPFVFPIFLLSRERDRQHFRSCLYHESSKRFSQRLLPKHVVIETSFITSVSEPCSVSRGAPLFP
jgi:hypothetical protein